MKFVFVSKIHAKQTLVISFLFLSVSAGPLVRLHAQAPPIRRWEGCEHMEIIKGDSDEHVSIFTNAGLCKVRRAFSPNVPTGHFVHVLNMSHDL